MSDKTALQKWGLFLVTGQALIEDNRYIISEGYSEKYMDDS